MRILDRLSFAGICAGMLVLAVCGCGEDKAAKQVALRQEGIELMSQGKYEEAVEKFQEGLNEADGRIDGMAIDLCYYKAESQEQMQDYEGALATYDALLAYEETDESYFLKGKLEYLMGDEEAGKKDFDKAIALDEKNLSIYINVYDVLCKHDQKELGEEYLKKAVEFGGNGTKDSFEKGRIQFALGNLESAKGYMETALKGNEASANFYLAQIASAQGDHAASKKYINAYMESGIASSEELEQLGLAELNQGDYVKAIAYFKNALELDNISNKQSIMKNCIIAYEYNLDFHTAKKMMDEYLEIYPDDEEAQRESIFINTRVED